ncbi:hypothetical protein [Cognaticolwellia mytili]|uniref:hypothetical protein n=1 Tax=Cognaticolwellia mytili TaxID=1888913 RepID=UPI000A16D774|nr:hypothetical protein [Cognaticolwellia mytili]
MKNIIFLLFYFITHYCWAEHVFVDGKEFFSLQAAKLAIKDGSRIYLKAGIYTEGVYLKANNIEIIGEKNVVFDNAAIDGKAALVLAGNDVLVESVECRNIHVKDLNGACIRFEGINLTVRDLYAHDSQSGVMTNYNDGFLKIEYSTFERLGGKAKGKGYAHAIYANVGEFSFFESKLLSMGEEGSGLKSRSRKTIVMSSLLATLDGKDSRLIDVANYGELIIKGSILQQGDNSSNSQLIAYGLENRPINYAINKIEITNNLFLLDRDKANVIIAYKKANDVLIENNVMIGDFLYPNEFSKRNPWYISREKAKLRPYPYLPNISELGQLINIIGIVGELN